MNLKIHHLGIPESQERNAWIEEQLKELGELEQIDAATVALVFYRGSSPAYSATVLLVTPGPDLHEEAIGCTMQQAIKDAIEGLRRRILERERNRAWQARSNRQRSGERVRSLAGSAKVHAC